MWFSHYQHALLHSIVLLVLLSVNFLFQFHFKWHCEAFYCQRRAHLHTYTYIYTGTYNYMPFDCLISAHQYILFLPTLWFTFVLLVCLAFQLFSSHCRAATSVKYQFDKIEVRRGVPNRRRRWLWQSRWWPPLCLCCCCISFFYLFSFFIYICTFTGARWCSASLLVVQSPHTCGGVQQLTGKARSVIAGWARSAGCLVRHAWQLLRTHMQIFNYISLFIVCLCGQTRAGTAN